MRKNQRNLSLHIFLFFFLIIARYKRAPHGGTALSLNIWPQKPWLKNYHSFLMVDLNPFPFFKIPLPILNPSCFFKKPFITTVTTVSLLESSIVSLQMARANQLIRFLLYFYYIFTIYTLYIPPEVM